VKIRFKDSVAGAGFAYQVGQVVDCPAPEGEAWVKSGHAEAVGGPEAATSSRPEKASRAVRPAASRKTSKR
jgi:hypothetical protein